MAGGRRTSVQQGLESAPVPLQSSLKSFSLVFNTVQVILLISFDKPSLHKG